MSIKDNASGLQICRQSKPISSLITKKKNYIINNDKIDTITMYIFINI